MPNSLRNPGLHALARAIVAARRDLGLSQRALAKQLPCDPATLANIELGLRRVDIVEFVIIARRLGMDPQTLIREVADVIPGGHSFR